MIAVILFGNNGANRAGGNSDTVLKRECIVEPAADQFRILCIVGYNNLGSVYAESTGITQPDTAILGVQYRQNIPYTLLRTPCDTGELVASVSDGYAVQISASFSFPGRAVLCIKLGIDQAFLIHAAEPGKEFTVFGADTAVYGLTVNNCQTFFVHRHSEVTSHCLDVFVVRVCGERDLIGSVSVSIGILIFEGLKNCLKLIGGSRHLKTQVLQPLTVDVRCIANKIILYYIRNAVDMSVRSGHFLSDTLKVQDLGDLRAGLLEVLLQRNKYALVYAVVQDQAIT